MQLEPSSNIYSRIRPTQYNINSNHETQYMNTRQIWLLRIIKINIHRKDKQIYQSVRRLFK